MKKEKKEGDYGLTALALTGLLIYAVISALSKSVSFNWNAIYVVLFIFLVELVVEKWLR